MKLLQYLKQPLPLRHRLMLTIGLILLVFQLISTFWLWHESTEQIQLFEQALRENRNNDRHIMHEIREAIASLIVPGIFMVSLALLICYQAVRRITRPLADLQKELEARAADNLTPIEIHSSTIEIQAVVSALNDLVTRLTSTIENERLFTADVAHELRTPLSGVRLHLELLSKTHKVDVSLLPQSAADVVVPGDVTLLRMLLRNLVENAHRYSPEGTHITISLNTEQDAVLAVEDEGPGIDESKCGELSKAFVRMDSRFGGIGLGLSIVSRITQLHQGHFYLQNRQGANGTRAWVELAKIQ